MDIVINYNSSMVYKIRDLNILKYMFRSIYKNINNINNIFLLICRDEEIPSFINQNNVNIIYYEDIILPKYLPTDNKNIAGLFTYNIPNLSENYLYLDIDIIITKQLPENYFFYNNLPNLQFENKIIDKVKESKFYWLLYNNATMINQECINNGLIDIALCMNLREKLHNSEFYIPKSLHFTPLLKSESADLFSYYLNDNNIIDSSKLDKMFMSEHLTFKNLTCTYYYPLMYYLSDVYNPVNYEYDFINLGTLTKSDILSIISNNKIVYFNPFKVEELEDLENQKIIVNEILEEMFPDKCIYEI